MRFLDSANSTNTAAEWAQLHGGPGVCATIPLQCALPAALCVWRLRSVCESRACAYTVTSSAVLLVMSCATAVAIAVHKHITMRTRSCNCNFAISSALAAAPDSLDYLKHALSCVVLASVPVMLVQSLWSPPKSGVCNAPAGVVYLG